LKQCFVTIAKGQLQICLLALLPRRHQRLYSNRYPSTASLRTVDVVQQIWFCRPNLLGTYTPALPFRSEQPTMEYHRPRSWPTALITICINSGSACLGGLVSQYMAFSKWPCRVRWGKGSIRMAL
jgi:hypothetical protein